MKFYGKTREAGETVLEAFKNPDTLPKALAPLFIQSKDGIPCRNWSWTNQLLVAMGGTDDARGYRQWEAVGRHVKKGSKAMYILVPCTKKVRKTDTTTGEEKLATIVYGFKGVPVFRYEDTEGETLPERTQQENWIQQLPLLNVAEAWGIAVEAGTTKHQGCLGFYVAGFGMKKIKMGVENLATWAHEMIHAADHRVNNLQGDKVTKEIVAELGGAILLTALGLRAEADLGGAYQYIQNYAAQKGQQPVQAALKLIDRTCKCVQEILEAAEAVAVVDQEAEVEV